MQKVGSTKQEEDWRQPFFDYVGAHFSAPFRPPYPWEENGLFGTWWVVGTAVSKQTEKRGYNGCHYFAGGRAEYYRISYRRRREDGRPLRAAQDQGITSELRGCHFAVETDLSFFSFSLSLEVSFAISGNPCRNCHLSRFLPFFVGGEWRGGWVSFADLIGGGPSMAPCITDHRSPIMNTKDIPAKNIIFCE